MLVALIALIDAWHPGVATTVVSSGKWSDPQVKTSVTFGLTNVLVKTNLKSLACVQLAVAGKLTFKLIPGGRIASRGGKKMRKFGGSTALKTLRTSWLYISTEVIVLGAGFSSRSTYDSCATLALDPEKAMEGIPSFAASHAAPLF